MKICSYTKFFFMLKCLEFQKKGREKNEKSKLRKRKNQQIITFFLNSLCNQYAHKLSL